MGGVSMTATELVYPVLLIGSFIMTLIMIPRDQYREYLMYGFVLGGLGDVAVVTILQNILGIIWFKNQGLFYVLGHNALSPLCWTLVIMLFLYFLPRRRFFLICYHLAWGLMSLGFGYLVQNAQLFDFRDWFYPIPALILFISWFTVCSWVYTKTSSLAKKLQ